MRRTILSLVALFLVIGTLVSLACTSATATPTVRPPTVTRPPATATTVAPTATKAATTQPTSGSTATAAATPGATGTTGSPTATQGGATATVAATATKPAATTPAAGGVPVIPANHVGRSTCLSCHNNGIGPKPLPAVHPASLPDTLATCQGCHKGP